jgi:hypothetical protein
VGALFDLIGDVILGAIASAIQERWGWLGCLLTLLTIVCLVGLAVILATSM